MSSSEPSHHDLVGHVSLKTGEVETTNVPEARLTTEARAPHSKHGVALHAESERARILAHDGSVGSVREHERQCVPGADL